MTDQQRCPECGDPRKTIMTCPACNGTGKKPAEKLAAPVPGQEPLVVPDSVIEEAVELIRVAMVARNDRLARAYAAGPEAFGAVAGPHGTDRRIAAEAAAPVIARWAREQGRAEERARIRRQINRAQTRLDLIEKSNGFDGDEYLSVEWREGQQHQLDWLTANLDEREEPA